MYKQEVSSITANGLLNLDELNKPYQMLDELPECLFSPVVTHPLGMVEQRATAIIFLRNNLLKGQLPNTELSWLPVQVQKSLYKEISNSNILPFCRDNTEVVDALLIDILKVLVQVHKSHVENYALCFNSAQQELLASLKAELELTESKRQNKSNKTKKLPIDITLSLEKLAEIKVISEIAAWTATLNKESLMLPTIWQERSDLWWELSDVFSDLQLVASIGFDLSKGFLQSRGWLNMVKLREFLGKLPQLQDVIRSLGRLKETDGEPISQTIIETIRQSYQVTIEVPTPFVPMETKGITRSDSISRMLPQEAILLGHPILKKLWHAKRAEHALISYAVEGTDFQTVTEEREIKIERQAAGRKKRKDRGPIIICLDTSGSMQGTPENIAKALVLECLSEASKTKRDCYVYLFGSANEVTELELNANTEGLDRLISFLCMSFGGGTDVEGPLRQALNKCKETKWHNADILLVSDGEFSYKDNLAQQIKRRKSSHALSVQGLLIGSHSSAMNRICDPMHHVKSWVDLM
jgi:uncharacterized protein with von Willebrand factor type A (vWA) domain|tara:strand:- start:18481 stop:20058 length:1578 start_codon:yes stop_codon:yes gene_type:complete